MNSFLVILLHTFSTKVKSKQFIVTTIITIAMILLMTNIPNIANMIEGEQATKQIAVIDESKVLLEPLQQFILDAEELELVAYSGELEQARAEVLTGELQGLLLLKINSEQLPTATYEARSLANLSVTHQVSNALQQLKNQMAATQINLTTEQLNKLYEPVVFERVALEENARTEQELNQARGLVYVLLFIIYFAVIMYASMIAMEVATEKSSRVMEILISSVSPVQHMFAKILGVGLLSITQLTLLLSVGFIMVQRNLSELDGGFFAAFGFADVALDTIVYAVIFCVLGYFLYATLAAFLGSLVSRIEDVNQTITPMTMLIVAGFIISMIGLGTPEARFIQVSSYIPFFTPMTMFMRVGMLNLPIWEPLLGIVILIVTIVVLAYFGAKIYRGGVLMYGKTSLFKDIKTALQFSRVEK